ncbi:hypothetical protein T10_5014 [Trichinella papuae]|uniref:Uncharacterized protein n=1 Tax=Trichinella papuae TaxID=268474 RepID=A0A0V1MGP6_9BILA|nr:hypothetical protein T10_5014 [Trichinella papuae]
MLTFNNRHFYLDARLTCCFCDLVTGSMLTAAAVSVKKRRSDILSIVCRQRLEISGDTWAVSVVRRCRFPTNRVGRTFGLSHRVLGDGERRPDQVEDKKRRRGVVDERLHPVWRWSAAGWPLRCIAGICRIAIPSDPSGFRSCRCLS